MCATASARQVAGRATPGGAPAPPGRFFFLGEALALDLVNTEIAVRGKPRDLLSSPEDLRDWWRAARSHYPDAGLAPVGSLHHVEAALAAAVALRGALRGIFSAAVDGRPAPAAALALVNRVLGTGSHQLVPAADYRRHAVFASRERGPDGLLLPIAYSAFLLLTGSDLARLRRCGNDRCVLLFYDTTRSATRRWCSAGCMNRARSSRRYRERKQRAAADLSRQGGELRRTIPVDDGSGGK